MRANLYLLAVVALVISSFGCKPNTRELEGSVFIVTKGRDNVKLGLVTISLHDANAARTSLHKLVEQVQARANDVQMQATPLALSVQELCADANPIAERYDAQPSTDNRAKLEVRREEINKVTRDFNSKIEPLNRIVKNYDHLCYEAIQQPLVTVKTDADGKFTMKIPRNGEFIITASASRDVGGRVEEYLWAVSVSLEGKPRDQIFLSNDNMISSGSSESVIPELPVESIKPLKEMPPL